MGVSGIINRVVTAGNGVTTGFSFPYYVFAKADIYVYLYTVATGAIVAKVLTTDYVINTTADAQGVFGSGLTVTMNVAPASGTSLVIVRAPTPTQAYALAQNGIISSLSTVQRLDYITLLVQRAYDMASRAIRLPDGVGATFDPLLPGTIALEPGAIPMVNEDGDGITFGESGLRVQVGTESAPTEINVSDGIEFDGSLGGRQTWYVDTASGEVSDSPIDDGTVVGQELRIVGTSDTNYPTWNNAANLSLNGTFSAELDAVCDLFWTGTKWLESSRS